MGGVFGKIKSGLQKAGGWIKEKAVSIKNRLTGQKSTSKQGAGGPG